MARECRSCSGILGDLHWRGGEGVLQPVISSVLSYSCCPETTQNYNYVEKPFWKHTRKFTVYSKTREESFFLTLTLYLPLP